MAHSPDCSGSMRLYQGQRFVLAFASIWVLPSIVTAWLKGEVSDTVLCCGFTAWQEYCNEEAARRKLCARDAQSKLCDQRLCNSIAIAQPYATADTKWDSMWVSLRKLVNTFDFLGHVASLPTGGLPGLLWGCTSPCKPPSNLQTWWPGTEPAAHQHPQQGAPLPYAETGRRMLRNAIGSSICAGPLTPAPMQLCRREAHSLTHHRKTYPPDSPFAAGRAAGCLPEPFPQTLPPFDTSEDFITGEIHGLTTQDSGSRRPKHGDVQCHALESRPDAWMMRLQPCMEGVFGPSNFARDRVRPT